jgi:hypothetical protein
LSYPEYGGWFVISKRKNQSGAGVSLKRVMFLYLGLILIALAFLIENDLDAVGMLFLIGIWYPISLALDIYHDITIDANGIEYRMLWKRKVISWNDISHIKIDLWYDFPSSKRCSMLIYKKNDSDKPYLSISSSLIEIPTLEIQENEKPNNYLRRLPLVKRHKLMVDSVQFEHTQFYQDVRNFAPHLQIEEDVAYT